jgi:hypothetical protein
VSRYQSPTSRSFPDFIQGRGLTLRFAPFRPAASRREFPAPASWCARTGGRRPFSEGATAPVCSWLHTNWRTPPRLLVLRLPGHGSWGGPELAHGCAPTGERLPISTAQVLGAASLSLLTRAHRSPPSARLFDREDQELGNPSAAGPTVMRPRRPFSLLRMSVYDKSPVRWGAFLSEGTSLAIRYLNDRSSLIAPEDDRRGVLPARWGRVRHTSGVLARPHSSGVQRACP